MKRFLFIALAGLLGVSCNKEDDPLPERPPFFELVAFTQPEDSDPRKDRARFYLFPADQNQVYKEDYVIIRPGHESYWSVKSDIVKGLKSNNELELESGQKVKAIELGDDHFPGLTGYYIETSFLSVLHTNIHIPEGRYYVVALCGSGRLGLSDRYSGRYLTISKDMDPEDRKIAVLFTFNDRRKGFVPWEEPTFKY